MVLKKINKSGLLLLKKQDVKEGMTVYGIHDLESQPQDIIIDTDRIISSVFEGVITEIIPEERKILVKRTDLNKGGGPQGEWICRVSGDYYRDGSTASHGYLYVVRSLKSLLGCAD